MKCLSLFLFCSLLTHSSILPAADGKALALAATVGGAAGWFLGGSKDDEARKQLAELDLDKLEIDVKQGKTVGSLLQAVVDAAPRWNQTSDNFEALQKQFGQMLSVSNENFKIMVTQSELNKFRQEDCVSREKFVEAQNKVAALEALLKEEQDERKKQAQLIARLMTHCNLNADESEGSQT